MTTTLRTTAILKTDIAGSTPRFRELPEQDLASLLSEHRSLLTRLAAAHDGRIVKPEGDGFWLAFPSVTAAALAAMSMQEELRLAQANTGDDRLAMRIVITLGDVLLVGTPWEGRLEPVHLEPMPAPLKDLGIYRLRNG